MEEGLVQFIKWVDNETYIEHGQRFWEDSNTVVTEEELAHYFINSPVSPFNNP